MIIVSAVDECYVPHFATMLHSAWTHNPRAQFYLLDCGIKPATLRKLAMFVESHGINLRFLTVDTAQFDGLPTHDWTRAIYARLLLPTLLPDSIERVIYLDADTLVLDRLADLWNTPLGSNAIAGMPDSGGLPMEERRGGYRFTFNPYVNSGVLLFNLPIWRHDYLHKMAISFVRQHPNLALPDQTAINAVCDGRIVSLGVEWDFMPADNKRGMKWITPRIVHWTGAMKPWVYKDAPFGALYRYHRHQTPFPLTVPPSKVYRSKLRSFVNLLIGRPKYWYRFVMQRRSEAFIDRYLTALAPTAAPRSYGPSWSAADPAAPPASSGSAVPSPRPAVH